MQKIKSYEKIIRFNQVFLTDLFRDDKSFEEHLDSIYIANGYAFNRPTSIFNEVIYSTICEPTCTTHSECLCYEVVKYYGANLPPPRHQIPKNYMLHYMSEDSIANISEMKIKKFTLGP